jgi:RND family efflux transporter MFP subunit
MRSLTPASGALLVTLVLAGCGRDAAPAADDRPTMPPGTPVAVLDTLVPDLLDAAGTAAPIRAATLSTKLMGSVTSMLVHEGDRVALGQLLVRLDARDLDAKRNQVEAGLAEATAMQAEAAAQAGRIRGLYADSAATKAQLDQAETGLARANAAVAGAQAMAAELAANTSYAEVRAPFAGIVTRRFVDPGSFAAPGAPLVTVEDASTLRVTVSASPGAVRGVRRGATVAAVIGDSTATATVEGVVPSGANLYTVNALVPNAAGRFQSGSSATLALPRGTRRALLVPAGAIVRQGDLTGVHVAAAGSASLRWVKLGRAHGPMVEVLSGLTAGDTVLAPDGTR